MDAVLSIGRIAAEPGTKRQGVVHVGDTPMGAIEFPLVVVNGAKPGPTLCLTAGVHAAEYPAIDAVLRTVTALEPAELSGTVVAVPVVNAAMFRARSAFLSPIDGLNLNRTFPGKADGTISEVLAHILLHDIVAHADALIDCHGGDLPEILWPYAGYPMTGRAEIDARGEAMARLFSPEIVALYREGSILPPIPGSLVHETTRLGIPAILAESGGAGGLDPVHTEVHVNGIRNVMRFLGMIPGVPVVRGPRMVAKDQFIVYARRGGLLRLAIEIGQRIEKDQLIAEVVDVFGQIVEGIVAPRAGIARLIWTPKAVNTGDPIVKCWVAEPAPPFPMADQYIQAARQGTEA